MGLRIQTNVAAMNAHRQLGITDTNMAKSLERLSSGFRINRASDDAAGLAIAGKLRVNVKSYVKAAENTAQANAMAQVAEGAMDQVENILNRMKELATQAGSTNTDATGRARLNDEFSALISEIDRIAESTKYGGTALIDGTFGAQVTAANKSSSMSTAHGIASASVIDVSGHVGASGSAYTIYDAANSGITLTNGAITQTVTIATGAQTVNFDKLGVKITLDNAYDNQSDLGATGTSRFTVTNSTQNIQVGSTADSFSQIGLTMANLQSSQAYGGGSAVSAWSVNAATDAVNLLDSIDSAITHITQKRGDIGAIQNRLGYAAANLATTIENVSAAESTIRDVDMASEMTSFTKSQILLQAGTAMLAQANMAPQQVLSLFG